MPVVNVHLEDIKGKSLWKAELKLPSSAQTSFGRSFVCDVRCDLFAASEWAILIVRNGFMSLSFRTLVSFGYQSASIRFKRGRRLVCQVVDSGDEPVLDLKRRISFSDPQLRALLPRADVYRDPRLRSIAAEVLLRDEVFERWRSHHKDKGFNLGEVIGLVSPLSDSLADEGSFPDGMMSRFIDCVMMIASYLCAEGPLTKLLRTESVREVMFNGHDNCWVESADGLSVHESPFSSWTDLRSWLDHHASVSGKEVMTDRACTDFALSLGARVHVALSPVSRSSGYVNIRCHRETLCSLEFMVQQGFMSLETKSLLEQLVKSKRNILVAGSTSSGKTTLVRALAECCDPSERIVVLEDVPELRISHPHCVYLQTAELESDDGCRAIGLDDLLREALRMRPDRMIVGECRGHEAFALIQALHTGHRGSFSTLHANSAADAVRRLEALLVRAEPSLSHSVVRQLIAGSFDVVVFLERTTDLRRRVSGVHFIEEMLC